MIPGSAWNWITVNSVQQSNLNEKMKQKTLMYMVIKPSIVLAAALLTAASFLAASTATAADPNLAYLMPTGRGGGHTDDGIQPYDPNPAAPGSNTREFLTYGVDADGNAVPLKTLRITNNTADTVYPIIAGSELQRPRE